ncbi:MAG: cellulase family glycosylhydrolase [Chloroflexi bacterium]|nr:cellulase family glycosylhydrolase [Chloroflexota bacterium]
MRLLDRLPRSGAARSALVIAALAVLAIGAFLIGQFLLTPACANDPAQLPISPNRPDGKPANYLHTCGSAIYDSRGHKIRITGINWFGMETETYAPHGLWSRSYKAILDQIRSLGYNSIRLPFSNEALEQERLAGGISYQANPDLVGLTGIETMDRIVEAARERGLKVILDRHRPTSKGQSPLWYTEDVTEERWIEDWRMLALRYLGDDTVIGIDLHNEPREEATWGTDDVNTDWRLAAERAGNAVLETNPYLLIFVQGTERFSDDYYWWGGNLQGTADHPVRLSVPNRVVYSPHDYGPDVFPQRWFLDGAFPRNLPGIWDRYWGYIQRRGIAPIVVGEFGGRSVASDAVGQWQRALLAYLHQNQIGFINWTLNPNTADAGGLLSDDWLTVVAEKQELYRRFLAPPIGSPVTARSDASKLTVLYHPSRFDQRNNIGISLQIVNDNPTPIAYSRLEIRYWFSAEQLRGRTQILSVDYAPVGERYVIGKFVQSGSGPDYYLSVTFDENAGTLPPYASSGELILRVHKSDWSDYDQSNDFSYGPFGQFQEWDHITAYLDGKLVWGRAP